MAEISIHTNGNSKQHKCAQLWGETNGIHDILYGGSKGSGKSFIGCSLIFADALMYPETHYFIARNELNDLRKFTIPSIHEVLNIWGITKDHWTYNGQDNFFQLYNNSKVFLLAAKYMPSDPKFMRFGSMQMTRGWIEEAGEFASDADTNLSISVGRWKNELYGLEPKVLRTCNPSKNYLYKDYYKPHKEGTLDSHKAFIQALPEDNKMLPDGYIEQLHRKLTKNEKERLLYGNWEYDNDPASLIEYDHIVEFFKNDHVPRGKKYITADVARYGSDKAIILVWQGWVVIERYEFGTSSTLDIQNKINELRIHHKIAKSDCIADEDGVGGGVVDNCGIKGFVNGSRALAQVINGVEIQEKFQNLKTQCAYYLANKIQSKEAWYAAPVGDDIVERITEEIEQLKRADMDNEKMLKIVSKKDMKAKIGRSPDDLDAMIFRPYFDLRPKQIRSMEEFFVTVI